MLSTQNTTDIILKFEQYVDDNSELSSADELDLANKKYQEVCDDRQWEILKKSASGQITISGGVASITVPSDFREFVINNEATDNSISVENNASPRVIFVGAAYTPYQVINFADRRQYLNTVGYAYIDWSQNKIIFTAPPTNLADLAYEFDYIKVPADLTLLTSPVFPARFWDVIYHLMAVDDQIIQIQDRAHSYMNENQAMAKNILARMYMWNAQLQNN